MEEETKMIDKNNNESEYDSNAISEIKEKIHNLQTLLYDLQDDLYHLEHNKKNNEQHFEQVNAISTSKENSKSNGQNADKLNNINGGVFAAHHDENNRSGSKFENDVLTQKKFTSKKQLKTLRRTFISSETKLSSRFWVWLGIFVLVFLVMVDTLYFTWVGYLLLGQSNVYNPSSLQLSTTIEMYISYLTLALALFNIIVLTASFLRWAMQKYILHKYARLQYIVKQHSLFSICLISLFFLAILTFSVILILVVVYGIYLIYTNGLNNEAIWLMEVYIVDKYIPNVDAAKIVMYTIYAIWFASVLYMIILTHQTRRDYYTIKTIKYFIPDLKSFYSAITF